MSIQITSLSENKSHDQFIDFLNLKIDDEAMQRRGLDPMHHYAFQAKDNEKVVGGIFGFDNFGALHIEGLWVDSNYRLKGIAKQLVKQAEEFAVKRQCKCIILFTMDFQALEFYQHLGYSEEFRRPHYHKHSFAMYMIKVLTSE